MSQQELLSRIVRILDGLGIGYMETGSVTSSLQGEPRSTHDIDLVVDPTEATVDHLLGEKQFTDALRVFEVQHDALDLEYMDEWASELGVESLWRRLRAEATPL
jgi:hypothetical protein